MSSTSFGLVDCARQVHRTALRFLILMAACGGAVDLLADNGPEAKSRSLPQEYGRGVHSYFAGDYVRSHSDLSSAIQGGIDDPRAWYFRGLAALKLGRLDEAEADFAEGAARESGAPLLWRVPQAIERVQGSER